MKKKKHCENIEIGKIKDISKVETYFKYQIQALYRIQPNFQNKGYESFSKKYENGTTLFETKMEKQNLGFLVLTITSAGVCRRHLGPVSI